LLMTFSCGSKATPQTRRKAWELALPASILVLGGALWFVALQVVVVKSICPWCMTAHTAGSIAAVMLLLRFPLKETADRRDKDPAVLRGTAMKLGLAALFAIALFAVAQIAVAPKTSKETSIPGAISVQAPALSNPVVALKTNLTAAATNSIPATSVLAQTNAPAPIVATTNVDAAVPPGWLGMFGGAVKLDLSQTPMWGSPEAPHKLVSLHDYSCHHCALMHSRVTALAHKFAPKLAVISLPMPLDGKCNPLLGGRTQPAHSNACAYARLGLAVWRAKPAAMEPYDDWFFGAFNKSTAVPQQPPTLDAATQRATELVGGAEKLAEALRDPIIEKQLATGISIYATSWKQYRNGSMPQFIIGTNLISGTPDVSKFEAVVENYVNGP